MQIVIDIDEYLVKLINENEFGLYDGRVYNAIRNGTPLPKVHGRLIDADGLVPDCQEQIVYFDDDEHNEYTAVGIYQIETAPTIIEAAEVEK